MVVMQKGLMGLTGKYRVLLPAVLCGGVKRTGDVYTCVSFMSERNRGR